MTISHMLQDFLAPGASAIAFEPRPAGRANAASKPLSAAWATIRRALRSRDTHVIVKELETCQAAMLRFNRAAILASLGSAIAHEMGQPLATIVSHARAGQRWLAGAQPSLREAGHSLAEIESAAWRASAIVESMRALMTADTTGYAVFDLNQAVGEALGILGERDLDARVAFEIILNDAPLWMRGDKVQIQQILLNLVVNALQAMRDTPRAARVTIRVGLAGGLATLEVADTGPGLSPAKMAHIFEPLYTTKSGGVGMGLAICRQIAESHGGALTALSSHDGAVFTLSLPQVSAPAQAA